MSFLRKGFQHLHKILCFKQHVPVFIVVGLHPIALLPSTSLSRKRNQKQPHTVAAPATQHTFPLHLFTNPILKIPTELTKVFKFDCDRDPINLRFSSPEIRKRSPSTAPLPAYGWLYAKGPSYCLSPSDPVAVHQDRRAERLFSLPTCENS